MATLQAWMQARGHGQPDWWLLSHAHVCEHFCLLLSLKFSSRSAGNKVWVFEISTCSGGQIKGTCTPLAISELCLLGLCLCWNKDISSWVKRIRVSSAIIKWKTSEKPSRLRTLCLYPCQPVSMVTFTACSHFWSGFWALACGRCVSTHRFDLGAEAGIINVWSSSCSYVYNWK